MPTVIPSDETLNTEVPERLRNRSNHGQKSRKKSHESLTEFSQENPRVSAPSVYFGDHDYYQDSEVVQDDTLKHQNSATKSNSTHLGAHNINQLKYHVDPKQHNPNQPYVNTDTSDNKYSQKPPVKLLNPIYRGEDYLHSELPRVIEVMPKMKKKSNSPVR